MTAADSSRSTPPLAGHTLADAGPQIPMQVVPHTAWDRVEVGLEWLGEFLNPILVKEARQALKSKQFVITLTLVLICGWGWSLLGIATLGEGVYYAPSGPYLLIGYFWVLAFPLLLIVPFAAFRSLASEREDGTYELLSITTLWPRQIIGGKFGSSILQMVVYLSALSPCLAFTYLLRGIDIISILLLISYVVLGSVLLSVGGLLVATVSRAKHWQVVLSVLMILFLAIIYLIAIWSASIYLVEGDAMPIDEPQFWVAHLLILSVAVSFFVLLFLAASARIGFASDNGSTRLRMVMLAQQTLITGWCVYYALLVKEFSGGFVDAEEFLVTYYIISAIYWIKTGSIMCGENPQLSQRVRRSLPQSLLARTLLTWFNPGPGTGYIFAVCNLLGALIVGLLVGFELKASQVSPLVFTGDGLYWHLVAFQNAIDLGSKPFWFGVLSVCYVVCYLGVGRLLLMVARRAARVGLFVSYLLQNVLLLLGTFIPLIFHLTFFYDLDYTVLLITSPFLTLNEVLRGDILSHQATFLFWTFPVVPVSLLLTTGLLLLLNLLFASSEAVHERQEAPQRVLEDERDLHPEKFEKPKRLSPWDEAPPK